MSNLEKIINWIMNKMTILYAFTAAFFIGTIWLIGELRLRKRICSKHRRNKKSFSNGDTKKYRIDLKNIRLLNK